MSEPSLRLTRSPDRGAWIETLAAGQARRVGLEPVLDDLDRRAITGPVPVRAASFGFRWADDDMADPEWWPQGITTSADAGDLDDVRDRRIVVVGWYAKPVAGRPARGARLSFVDVSDPTAPRYRHVLLMDPALDAAAAEVTMEPVRVHAGGIVWYGRTVLVADTHGGIRAFCVDDILRVADGDDRYAGHRYVLPQRHGFDAVNDDGFSPFRFSFVSLDRSGDEHELLAGEYGVSGQTTRLAAFALDGAEASLALVDDSARPRGPMLDGLTHMQGATIVDDTCYMSVSRGRRRGAMWTRREGSPAREHPASLAIGCEDLTYWPGRDEIWSVSEYPGGRYVYAMPRSAFAHPPGRLKALYLRLRHGP